MTRNAVHTTLTQVCPVMASIWIGTREPAFAGSLGFVPFECNEILLAEPSALPSHTGTSKVAGRSHLYTREYPGRLGRRHHSFDRRRCNSTFSDTARCRLLRSVHRPCIDLLHMCLFRCRSCCLRPK